MRKIRIIISTLLFCSLAGYSQSLIRYAFTDFPSKNWKSASLMYVAGFADGHAELLSHHYYKFERTFPNANPQFWNPELSWVNKYKNGDPNQGPKYFGSTNAFVLATDGYHACKFVQKSAIVAALVIKIGEKKKLKFYIVDAVMYLVTYTLGFYTSYSWMYR